MKLFKSALACTFAATLFFTSCSSGDDENFSISENKLTLHFEEKEQLTATSTAEWSSENDFVAKVNSNGLVEGNHVGKTNIIATSNNGRARCEVEVVPVYSTYKEPFLEFGASKSAVKSFETRTFFKEQSSSIAYYGENSSVELVLYSFDTNEKLKGVAVALSFTCASEVAKFLLERYQPIGEDDGIFAFINNNEDEYTMGITLSVESAYIAVMYLPMTANSRSGDFENRTEELKSLFNDAIKSKNIN